MKSNKQRRLEIKTKRRKRAETLKINAFNQIVPWQRHNSIDADRSQLMHNSYYVSLPTSYSDKPFKCQCCGKHEIWSAQSQKWWYEVAKGNIESTAISCRACRIKIRQDKEQQKIHMALMAQQAPHSHDAFFRKRY